MLDENTWGTFHSNLSMSSNDILNQIEWCKYWGIAAWVVVSRFMTVGLVCGFSQRAVGRMCEVLGV